MFLYTNNIDWKVGNYYPEVFLEKFNFNDDIEYSDEEYSNEKIQISWKNKQNIRNFRFSGFASPFHKCKKGFFNLRAKYSG